MHYVIDAHVGSRGSTRASEVGDRAAFELEASGTVAGDAVHVHGLVPELATEDIRSKTREKAVRSISLPSCWEKDNEERYWEIQQRRSFLKRIFQVASTGLRVFEFALLYAATEPSPRHS